MPVAARSASVAPASCRHLLKLQRPMAAKMAALPFMRPLLESWQRSRVDALKHLREYLKQCSVNQTVGSDNGVAFNRMAPAAHLRDAAAGFGDDQRPGGHVPRLQVEFPECVHA